METKQKQWNGKTISKLKQSWTEFKCRGYDKEMKDNVMLEEATEKARFMRGFIWMGGRVY